MGLLDRLKRKKKEPEELTPDEPEPIEGVEQLSEPTVEPAAPIQPAIQPQPQPQPITEPAGIPEQTPNQYPQDLQLQKTPAPEPAIDPGEVTAKLELINSKIDTLKLEIEKLNQAITVINAKLK